VTLADRILGVVSTAPGVTTNLLCRRVKVRKSDVLRELEELQRNRFLRFEHGPRASKS
jgi:hypothetical protein